MKVFMTGASGFIGSAVTAELSKAGHRVLGLTHSNDGAAMLKAAGVEILEGNVNDAAILQRGIEHADAVIHCAYMHGFDRIDEASKQEIVAIRNLGKPLLGTNKPLLITSVAAMGIAQPGNLAIEEHFNPHQQNPRNATESTANELAKDGVQVSVIRLPQVHNIEKLGIVSDLIKIAHQKRCSAYVGNGDIRWAAAHVLDVAHLYRLVLEEDRPGRYHAVAEEGISLRHIAEVIGQGLNVPVISLSKNEAKNHFGPFAFFMGFDMSASSEQTRRRVNWQPTHPGLIQDLERFNYSSFRKIPY
jgi:nucleoside-diphosphate-sugar epimerase